MCCEIVPLKRDPYYWSIGPIGPNFCGIVWNKTIQVFMMYLYPRMERRASHRVEPNSSSQSPANGTVGHEGTPLKCAKAPTDPHVTNRCVTATEAQPQHLLSTEHTSHATNATGHPCSSCCGHTAMGQQHPDGA